MVQLMKCLFHPQPHSCVVPASTSTVGGDKVAEVSRGGKHDRAWGMGWLALSSARVSCDSEAEVRGMSTGIIFDGFQWLCGRCQTPDSVFWFWHTPSWVVQHVCVNIIHTWWVCTRLCIMHDLYMCVSYTLMHGWTCVCCACCVCVCAHAWLSMIPGIILNCSFTVYWGSAS